MTQITTTLAAYLLPLWSSLVGVLSAVDWLTLAAYLLATGGLSLLAKVWVSRQLWGAKVPWLAAAFELLEIFGFSPTAFGAWVRRRSWYRKGQTETGKLRRIMPGGFLLVALVGCSSGQLPEGLACPLPDLQKATLPAAISLARAVLSLASSSCGPSCPPELLEAGKGLDRAEATAKTVCDAIAVARLVPCEQCSDRLEAVSKLIQCAGAP
jgi:hypothetical protein